MEVLAENRIFVGQDAPLYIVNKSNFIIQNIIGIGCRIVVALKNCHNVLLKNVFGFGGWAGQDEKYQYVVRVGYSGQPENSCTGVKIQNLFGANYSDPDPSYTKANHDLLCIETGCEVWGNGIRGYRFGDGFIDCKGKYRGINHFADTFHRSFRGHTAGADMIIKNAFVRNVNSLVWTYDGNERISLNDVAYEKAAQFLTFEKNAGDVQENDGRELPDDPFFNGEGASAPNQNIDQEVAKAFRRIADSFRIVG